MTAGCDAVRATGSRRATQCGAFRRVVPWEVVDQTLAVAYAETMAERRAAARTCELAQNGKLTRMLDCPAPTHSRPQIPTPVTGKRRLTMPPRPATLPPAPTVAQTWMTGAVEVLFAYDS